MGTAVLATDLLSMHGAGFAESEAGHGGASGITFPGKVAGGGEGGEAGLVTTAPERAL